MKNTLLTIALFVAALSVNSCKKEEDEGKLPNISFKTAAGYVHADTTIAAGDSVLVGIEASKAESADVLKQFNLSTTINSGSSVSVYDRTLTGTEGDAFAYDMHVAASPTAGDTITYKFTVTNRDGLVNYVSMKVIAN